MSCIRPFPIRAALTAVAVVAGLGAAVADVSEPQAPARPSRTFELVYRFEVTDVPAGARSVLAWAPLPASTKHQRLASFELAEGHPYRIVADPVYANRWVLLDLSAAAARGGRIPVTLRFVVTRWAYRVEEQNGGDVVPPHLMQRYLSADRLVPISGRIAEEARRVAGSARTPMEAARRLYEHVIETVRYDKSGDGWGRGDAVYACDVRKGNCTDFHSLFIGEARALGIPARFVIGFPLPPDAQEGTVAGYHCWAEFYVDGRGWIPIDASEAHKHPEKRESLFGGLDAHRIEFTIGRDIRLPEAVGGPLNYVIHPYVEVDRAEHGSVERQYRFRELDS